MSDLGEDGFSLNGKDKVNPQIAPSEPASSVRRFLVKVKPCKCCKGKSSDPNPIKVGQDGVEYHVTLVWLYYHTDGQTPLGHFCGSETN